MALIGSWSVMDSRQVRICRTCLRSGDTGTQVCDQVREQGDGKGLIIVM